MKWVDEIEKQNEENHQHYLTCEYFDLVNLIAAVRILETALDEIARVSYCEGINHKITSDKASAALDRVEKIRNV